MHTVKTILTQKFFVLQFPLGSTTRTLQKQVIHYQPTPHARNPMHFKHSKKKIEWTKLRATTACDPSSTANTEDICGIFTYLDYESQSTQGGVQEPQNS